MKKICIALPLAVLSLTAASFLALASSPEAQPPLTLTIATREAKVKSGHVDPLIVKEKNISNQVVDIAQGLDETSHFGVEILRDGEPVSKTKEMLRRESARNTPRGGGSMFSFSIQPGQEAETDFHIGDYYDMTVPGVYQITLVYNTNTYDPTKNIPIKSNTVTITVIPPDPSTTQ